MNASKFRKATVASVIALIAATVTAVPAEAYNPCGSKGYRVAVGSSWGYAAVGDDDSTCGVVAVQMRFIEPDLSYTYKFRRKEDPYPGAYYYTDGSSSMPGAWRACSYGEGGNFSVHCKETATSWEFGAWRYETTPTVFS